MTERFDHEGERAELRKLIAHYDERADYYEHEYQVNGIPSQERAWMRNQRMADALRDALSGKDTKQALSDLACSVMLVDVGDPDKCVRGVMSLQKRIAEGRY